MACVGGSWVVSRGSCVVGRTSWVVRRASCVVCHAFLLKELTRRIADDKHSSLCFCGVPHYVHLTVLFFYPTLNSYFKNITRYNGPRRV